jgi:hypothetical protein
MTHCGLPPACLTCRGTTSGLRLRVTVDDEVSWPSSHYSALRSSIMDIPIDCDDCHGPIDWRLERQTENWDFYRAYCSEPCRRSMLTQPRGGTNHATRKGSARTGPWLNLSVLMGVRGGPQRHADARLLEMSVPRVTLNATPVLAGTASVSEDSRWRSSRAMEGDRLHLHLHLHLRSPRQHRGRAG